MCALLSGGDDEFGCFGKVLFWLEGLRGVVRVWFAAEGVEIWLPGDEVGQELFCRWEPLTQSVKYHRMDSRYPFPHIQRLNIPAAII